MESDTSGPLAVLTRTEARQSGTRMKNCEQQTATVKEKWNYNRVRQYRGWISPRTLPCRLPGFQLSPSLYLYLQLHWEVLKDFVSKLTQKSRSPQTRQEPEQLWKHEPSFFFLFLLLPVGLWVLVRGAVCAATYVVENQCKKKKKVGVTVCSQGEIIVPCFLRLREGPQRAKWQKKNPAITTTTAKTENSQVACDHHDWVHTK